MSIREILYHPISGKTNNLLLFCIALIPAFVLFHFPESVFSNGIDQPLAWVFNYLIQGKLSLGKSIIFPHGPLAFLMYPLPMGSNLWIAIGIHFIARVFLAYSLLKLGTNKPLGYLFFALIASFILLSINDILLTIVQIILLCYLNFFERRNVTWLIPALIITPIALFIKAFVGIVSLVITLTFAGIMIHRSVIGFESRYRLLLFFIVPFTLILVWFGMYGDLHGLITYLKGMIDLATDNSAAASIYPDNNWWIIGIATISGLIMITINLKNITLVRTSILFAPVLFAVWKYGMAREDYVHSSMMFVMILFMILVYNLLMGKFRILNSFISVIIIVGFYLTLQKSYYFEPFHIEVKGLQTLVTNATNYTYFADTCNHSDEKSIARNKLDDNLLKLIGTNTVDVYPWDYTYIAANHLNWCPRPVIQSYASYTRDLDELDARHFESKKAPEFIIWELRKITRDIHGGTLESIDARYLLNDEPETFLTLLSNYELVATQGGGFPVLVYKKRADVLNPESSATGQLKTTWNTWIDVPDAGKDILKAAVTMQRNTLGKLKGFFYKDEATYVYMLLGNGDFRMFRIVPKNAAYGLWINPLVINPELKKREPAVKKIMFRCSNTAMMKDDIKVEWNKLTFTQKSNHAAPGKINPINSFFGITRDTLHKCILLSENNLETQVKYWSQPSDSSKVMEGSNHLMNLFPDKYSSTFEFPLDSINLESFTDEIIIRANVWAKSQDGAEAVFALDIEKNGESLSMNPVEIQGFFHDKHKLNYSTNFSVLKKEMFEQKGLILKVYIWNTGKVPILLDDFSVRIETR